MLDLLYFVLAAIPLVSGLALVVLAFKQRLQVSAAPVKRTRKHPLG